MQEMVWVVIHVPPPALAPLFAASITPVAPESSELGGAAGPVVCLPPPHPPRMQEMVGVIHFSPAPARDVRYSKKENHRRLTRTVTTMRLEKAPWSTTTETTSGGRWTGNVGYKGGPAWRAARKGLPRLPLPLPRLRPLLVRPLGGTLRLCCVCAVFGRWVGTPPRNAGRKLAMCAVSVALASTTTVNWTEDEDFAEAWGNKFHREPSALLGVTMLIPHTSGPLVKATLIVFCSDLSSMSSAELDKMVDEITLLSRAITRERDHRHLVEAARLVGVG
ncbi:hypothetical protein AJ80_08286 [Polytolypa hystricis UAMH7299]|uniref:Uncharacterized protein n=1 Tax=Polytolypa hystricis (strain UAMH7299) TaxID=1447883 RepID=A0A2B7XA07_POLH7|nr:hypothetical protein AJ80_08286 [Polytolypa hystricis UAMH7299]